MFVEVKTYHLTRYFLFVLVFFVIFFIVIYDLLCFTIANQKFKIVLLVTGTEHSQKQQQLKKATKRDMKGQALNSIKENNGKYNSSLDGIGENFTELEGIMKTQNIISFVVNKDKY